MNSFELEVVGRDGVEFKDFNVLIMSGLSFRTIAVGFCSSLAQAWRLFVS